MAAPRAEIATVIQNFLPELQGQHPLPGHLARTMRALQFCRTEAMGFDEGYVITTRDNLALVKRIMIIFEEIEVT